MKPGVRWGMTRPLLPLPTASALALTVLGVALSACAPRMVTPQTQIESRVRLEGNLLSVTLTNRGPVDLILKNDCPRPFALSVQDIALPGQAVRYAPLNTCTVALPPVMWRVGQGVEAVVEFPLTSGTRTLTATASANVKLASDQQAEFRVVRVNVAPFEVNIR